ncbi:MAG: aminoglycoside phosphotransferase family protein [Solirubrobacteraceae bacterium]
MDDSERSCLERIARDVASEWGIVIGPPFQLSNYSYVAPAGPAAVLKIRSPEDDGSGQEADALELWAGNGAVGLLRVDRSRRALLLERACPGSDLAPLADAAATTIAVEVTGRLWRPAAALFRWIGDHVPEWLAQATPSSAAGQRLLERARELFDGLDVDGGTLVHGDFHHHNILDAGTRYIAIDPKPMVGEPEFDVAPFLWNALGSQMTQEETERRLAAFAQAGLDQARMRAWALIRGAYLDVGDWVGEHALDILEAIQTR